jgi:chromosome segregation ATPase
MGMFTEWRDDENAKLRQQLQEALAENAALVAEFQRLADEPPTLEEIAADLDKIEMLEKELAEARAEIARLKSEEQAQIDMLMSVTGGGIVCANGSRHTIIDKCLYCELAERDKLIEQMKKLLKAVECSEFEGPICFDIDGKNWYDAREAALSAAERGE